MGFINKIFGTHSQHELKRIKPIVDKILGMREQWVALSDEELQHKTVEFKERLAKGETLDDILPEAFATVREASRRVLGEEHYPVQLTGGIVLHQGRIARVFMSLLLTTIWHSVMLRTKERFTDSLVLRLAVY